MIQLESVSVVKFESEYSVELRDFNSAGVVAANQGLPLSKMYRNIYKVYDMNIKVSQDKRDKCRETIYGLVEKLSLINSTKR